MSATVPAIRSISRPPSGRGFVTDDAKWKAVCCRNPAADEHFLYAVRTTGVYCRPSCAARPARRENVTFHPTRAEAEWAGYRPCKRCRPDLPPRAEREAALVADACRHIEACEEPPKLADVAARAGVTPYHFHRMFKRIAGVTPMAYAAAHRQERAQDQLHRGSGVTESLYAAGFNSSSRFYESAPAMLGMKPSTYRRGAVGEAIWHTVRRCSLGRVLVAATERGVCAILFGDDRAELVADLRRRFPKAKLSAAEPRFSGWVKQAVRSIDDSADASSVPLPLDVRGTAFQRRVWEVLRQIPAGQTASYAEIAKRLGKPKAARAVAGACAANHLAVAIPCHRIVASDGKLAGYRWGTERKKRLLEKEKRVSVS